MSSVVAWVSARAPTLKAIALGSTSWPLFVGAAWVAWPEVAVPATEVGRVTWALQLGVVPAFALHLVLQGCWRIFDTPQAEDPLVGGESQRWRINQRVLANTVEQALMFGPVLTALAVRVPAEHARIVPILATAWFLGRMAFWVGYHVAPNWRAPGMDWTYLSSLAALAWWAWTWA